MGAGVTTGVTADINIGETNITLVPISFDPNVPPSAGPTIAVAVGPHYFTGGFTQLRGMRVIILQSKLVPFTGSGLSGTLTLNIVCDYTTESATSYYLVPRSFYVEDIKLTGGALAFANGGSLRLNGYSGSTGISNSSVSGFNSSIPYVAK